MKFAWKKIFSVSATAAMIGSFVPMTALAATKTNHGESYEVMHTIVNGDVIDTFPSISNATGTNIPLWYIMKNLNQLHINSTWNGSRWMITTPSHKVSKSASFSSQNGNAKIYLNGSLLGAVTAISAVDPFSGHKTTYLPQQMVAKVLATLNIAAGFKGGQWQWNTTRADVLLGTAASPPMGKGNGAFWEANPAASTPVKTQLSSGANAFRAAIVGNTAYVPVLQGKTYVVNLSTHKVESSFSTPRGIRIANIANSAHLLLLTGPSGIYAYSLKTDKLVWKANVPGNALAVVGNEAYVSSNKSASTTRIDLTNGKTLGTVPVGHIEYSVYDQARHSLWLANWFNGDMTVVNTDTHTVSRVIHTSEGDPKLSMSNMMKVPAAYMQLAVGPNGQYVYAAGFSGHILVFDARSEALNREIKVGGKLSGLAISGTGNVAYTTVESADETVAVNLSSGAILWKDKGVMSDRWFTLNRVNLK